MRKNRPVRDTGEANKNKSYMTKSPRKKTPRDRSPRNLNDQVTIEDADDIDDEVSDNDQALDKDQFNFSPDPLRRSMGTKPGAYPGGSKLPGSAGGLGHANDSDDIKNPFDNDNDEDEDGIDLRGSRSSFPKNLPESSRFSQWDSKQKIN